MRDSIDESTLNQIASKRTRKRFENQGERFQRQPRHALHSGGHAAFLSVEPVVHVAAHWRRSRACLEQVPSLAFDLFDASLYACWEELASTATGEAAESSSALAAALQAAMEAESMPTALLGRLLSAADFCERAGTPLDISWRTLGALHPWQQPVR